MHVGHCARDRQSSEPSRRSCLRACAQNVLCRPPAPQHPSQAIERVNDLDPEILEEQQELFFHLQQQRLIELIRGGQLAEALEFAQVGRVPLCWPDVGCLSHNASCGVPWGGAYAVECARVGS